jgi:glucan phosphoethanolaminetransferase (alkaline phosphatase superfamily)
MFSFLRPTNLFVLLSYAALTSVPLLPVLTGQTIDQPYRIAGMEFVAWLAIWAIFKRPTWFHWLLAPAFLALPVELYLRVFYGQGISTHHLGIIAETSPREALEFLGNKVWLLIFILASVIAWWWFSWKAARRTRDLDWNDKSRWAILFLLALGTGIWSYGYAFGVQAKAPASLASNAPSIKMTAAASTDDSSDDEDNDEASNPATSSQALPPHNKVSWLTGLPPLPAWLRIPFEPEAFADAWPFGFTVRAYDFWKEREYLVELAHNSNLFKFGAHQISHTDLPQVIVMVIGESSRYDRWSLNGYRRETNPLLKNESNLVSLSNVVTAVSATRLSVPILVSRKPATQSLKAGFAEKSFLTAFKEAGFKTYWLSNQMSFGQFDTPVSVFANEADVTQFLNLGGFTNNSSFDQILLDPLKNALNDPAQKKLIVLHTLGNHWNYSHRHPKQFDKWQPSLFGIENPAYTDLKIKTQLNNSYDNSILYTDWFLSQVIDTLKSTKQLSSLMYVSDHGQTLYDGTCNLAFHGHNTQYEFHIPAFVWYSDSYGAIYPEKIRQLKLHRNAKLATENIFHSLLDMGDIHYSTEQLQWSFFNPKLKRHKRYVDSYGWTDYDHATFKGDCREVIDKGHPLVQEK